MENLLTISPFVSMLLVCTLIILVLYLLTSLGIKKGAAARETNKRPKQGRLFMGRPRFPRCWGTAAISWEDEEHPFTFKDSWKNGLGQTIETKSAFTDRAFSMD